MSKNLFKKGLAFGAVLSLGVTGFTGIAASAATGDVTLAPTSGTGSSAFSTDSFSLTAKVKSTVSPTQLAYRIDNPDQNQLLITLATTATLDNFDAIGYKEDGTSVTTGLGAAVSGNDLLVDFVDLDIVSLVLYNLDTSSTDAPAATGNTISVKLDESSVTNTNTTTSGADAFDYAQLTAPVSVSVQAWVEVSATPDYKTVDADYASAKAEVTFVDPSSVNVISKIERLAGATFNNKLTEATTTVRVSGSGDSSSATDTAVGATLGGVTLVEGDRILLTDTKASSPVHGIYTVDSSGAATATDTTLTGDVVLVLDGTNRGKVYNASHTTLLAGSDAVATSLNAADDNVISASVDFSNPSINLAQVDLAKWDVAVSSSSDDDVVYGSAALLQVGTPAGYTEKDGLGRLFVQAPVSDLGLNESATYSLKFRHSGPATSTVALVESVSTGFQVVTSPSSTAIEIKAVPTVSADAKVGTDYSSGYSVALRNGVTAVTYKSTILDSSEVAVKAANVPVLAVVTAGANLPTGATIQVSGASEAIKAASATSIVSGLTDSDGNWSVTVTSSDATSAGSNYTIRFYVLKGSTTPDAWDSADGTSSNNAIYKADYAAAALDVAAFLPDSSVLSGANPTVTFEIKDQFGQPLSATSAGKAYSVELKAANKTNLEQFVAVSGGKATFTFKNYLTSGSSEQLTAKLFTGSSTSPTYVAGAVAYLSLYNTNAVAGVNVVTEVTAVEVSYEDFITGASSATNVAPSTSGAVDFTYTGTVVDANGAGVPGAPVTISGKGLQFVKTGTTTYYQDSITIAATEAGTFSVEAWTHVLSSTGNVITVKSGDKTATTKVKSVLPSALSAKNLQFSWSTPALTVMNTTYSVSASVTDKWENPIAGATVNFDGLGSATINGLQTTVAKLTDKNGKAQVYLRSLKDIDGISTLMATLADTVVATKTWADAPSATLTDATTTKWDESKWTNVLEKSVDFLAKKPTASISKGTKSSTVVVKNANGTTVKVVRGTKSTTVAATSNSQKVTLKGGTGKVTVYVNGIKVASK